MVTNNLLLYTYLYFCIAGTNGEVLSIPVPPQRCHIERVGLKLTEVGDASFLRVENVDRSPQGNCKLVASSPVQNVEICMT